MDDTPPPLPQGGGSPEIVLPRRYLGDDSNGQRDGHDGVNMGGICIMISMDCRVDDTHGSPRVSIGFHGSPWIPMEAQGHHRDGTASMDLHRCPWVSIDFH